MQTSPQTRQPGSGILLFEKEAQGRVALFSGPLTLLDGREYQLSGGTEEGQPLTVIVRDTKGWTKKAEFKLQSFVNRTQQQVYVDLIGHVVAKKGQTTTGRPCIFLNIKSTERQDHLF